MRNSTHIIFRASLRVDKFLDQISETYSNYWTEYKKNDNKKVRNERLVVAKLQHAGDGGVCLTDIISYSHRH